MLDVHGADIDDNTDVRHGNMGQVCHLPEMVHAHLQYHDLRIRLHGENSHGHADVIIVVHRGLAGTVGGAQDGGHHLLGGGLAHGAGDAHHLGSQAPALLPGDDAQGRSGVLHDDAGVIPHAAAAQGRGSALFHCHWNEVMSIPCTLEHDEELTGLNDPGIVVRAEELDVFIFGIHIAAAPERGLLQCELRHITSSIPAGGLQPLPVRPDGFSHHLSPGRFHDPFPPV